MTVFVNQIRLGDRSGLRVAIKDSIDIAGQRTCAGSRALAEVPQAARNAEVVDAILATGWQIVGKTNMHELAFGVTGINDWTGTPLNPQAPDRVTGGSSSGSAVAVAAGLADVALGTDTGGSVRVPAACCGIYGLKPTFGRVSRAGVHPAVTSLDCVGPFAARMADLDAAMAVICPGYQPFQLAGGGQRVALLDVPCDPLIRACLERAVALAGWQRTVLRLEGLGEAFEAGLAVINHETWAAFGHLTGKGLVGADVEQRLLGASRTGHADLAHAEQVRARFTRAVDTALEQFEVLLLPTLPELPPLLAEARQGNAVGGMTRLARPFNLSGHPALSVPVPLRQSGLKVGLQIVGRKGEDERVCAFGANLEHALAALQPANKNPA
ncbi:amidase [Pseudomonas sp. GCM10022186]|uniref:amidase n=1 Tax=Pseudomonas sp. GCM10022186 TaxID=3252650 RepID=UPI003612EEEF